MGDLSIVGLVMRLLSQAENVGRLHQRVGFVFQLLQEVDDVTRIPLWIELILQFTMQSITILVYGAVN